MAGAPGEDAVWLSPLRVRLEPGRPMSMFELDPFPVVCLGTNELRVLVGAVICASAADQAAQQRGEQNSQGEPEGSHSRQRIRR